MSDLTSFDDIYSERRKHTIKRLAAERDSHSDEASLVWQDNEKLTSEVGTWESAAVQYESENSELKKELGTLKYRVEEAERVRHQIKDLESQLVTMKALTTLPQELSGVLRTIATLFPERIEIARNAALTSASYAEEQNAFWGRPEGLAIAWEMAFGVATRLYEIVFHRDSNRLEEEFRASFSNFELAMSEGKQTKKDSKLMDLRKISHNGGEFDITPHIKFGNRKPKMLRLHFAISRETKKIIIGHFGDHLDNYTTKKQ